MMRESDTKTTTALAGGKAEMSDDVHGMNGEAALPPPRSAQPEERRADRRGEGATPFTLYKPGQGARVRWGSAIAAGALALWGASFVHEQMPRFISEGPVGTPLRLLIPIAFLAFCAWGIFRLVGQNRRVVEFMIATDAEMKKVNWSSRREVLGATKVVIITVLALAFVLFFVDLLFILFFSGIRVLQIDVGRFLNFGGGS